MKPHQDMVLAPDGDSPLLWIDRTTFLFLMDTPVRGKNIYVCEVNASHRQVTLDIHRGVTPFLKKCPVPGCSGTGLSSMYMVEGWKDEPEWEWYRPSRDEYPGLQLSMKEHVMRGGLMIRKRIKMSGQDNLCSECGMNPVTKPSSMCSDCQHNTK